MPSHEALELLGPHGWEGALGVGVDEDRSYVKTIEEISPLYKLLQALMALW